MTQWDEQAIVQPSTDPDLSHSVKNSAIARQVERDRESRIASLLRIYNYYRLTIGAALLVLFLNGVGEQPLGSLNQDLFLLAVSLYLLLNIVFTVLNLTLWSRLTDHGLVIYSITALDILWLVLLTHFSGGVTSGLGTLIIVSVAAGSILIQGRISTSLAALGTIALIYEEFYLSLLPGAPAPSYIAAGFLGTIYFGTSLVIQTLSQRLKSTELTSLTRAAEVAILEQLNHLIIQRMQTGIIVTDSLGGIRLINQSAARLLGHADGSTVNYLPSALLDCLAQWHDYPDTRFPPFALLTGGPEIRINFSSLDNDATNEAILFIEDNSELQQQAQQLKLAALGRLSASIAHEIRNPLGAISHAAQLLKESENLDKGDARLTDIIHNHCIRMNGVIENVLELSRRRAPEPERLELKGWLEELVEELRESTAEPIDVLIQVEPENVVVQIDPSQLRQVVTNLAENGLRYSRMHTGNASLVLAAGADSSTERPFLNIIDQGTGVPEDKINNLFEPFYTTEASGTGLGLYISRELCEANQARLTYQTDDGGGACFQIVFPHPKRIIK